MLETEDFDDDYFTPVASASLANIFGKPVLDDKSDNESLKYVPPKPQNIIQQPEESKATSCIFACALAAYIWHNNTYTSKGKIGLALIKILKSATHNVILYDSSKTTLSSVTISSKLKISFKGNNYVSYYDDQSKYWSLYGTEDEIKKIKEYLKDFGATIVTLTDIATDANPPEPIKTEAILQPKTIKQVGSDTDSSENRKTKAAILNRMATMGNFILPPKPVIPEVQTSDSDTDYHISVRNKFPKSVAKKNSIDKKILEPQKTNEMLSNDELVKHSQMTLSNNISDQLVPLAQTTFVTHPSSQNMDLFITEQRVNNSELRINLGKMNDKVDSILTKFNDIDLNSHSKNNVNVNTEITNKLLREYENKINIYENLIKQMADKQTVNVISSGFFNIDTEKSSNNKLEIMENELKQKDIQIDSLETKLKEKDNTVSLLEDKIQTLINNEKQSDTLAKTVSELQDELKRTQNLLKDITKQNELLKAQVSTQYKESEVKIKSVMNDTYHAVASKFEENDTYLGGSIKKTVALVIKKNTLAALNVNN